jgi:hypothetical protein
MDLVSISMAGSFLRDRDSALSNGFVDLASRCGDRPRTTSFPLPFMRGDGRESRLVSSLQSERLSGLNVKSGEEASFFLLLDIGSGLVESGQFMMILVVNNGSSFPSDPMCN